MDIDHDLITRLIAQPTEGLNQELKRWLDPGVAVDQAKIIKASVALYNRNGGYLIIGFDDKTRQPAPGAPTDVRQTFSADRIQELISRHASDRFEIAMGFGERDGQEYPVIVVPPGVRVPVGIGRALVESGADLLKVGDIPIRTLHANGTFSTAIAGPKDWPAMLEICFDNREADIGRFIRRHLGVLAGALNASGSSDEAVASIRQRATDFLNFGWARYRQAKTRLSNLSEAEVNALEWGKWEVAAVIDPPIEGRVADQEFYTLLMGSNPRYMEWPSWSDTSEYPDQRSQPDTRDGGWEAFLLWVNSHIPSDFIAFTRLEPDGKFYQIRALDDDALARMRGGKTGSSLDFNLMTAEIAESIAVALRFALALGCDAQTTKVGFSFRWRGLSGRNLHAWYGRLRTSLPLGPYTASDSEAESFVTVPLETSESALAPFVETAVRHLLAKFRGYSMSREKTESCVRLLLERKL